MTQIQSSILYEVCNLLLVDRKYSQEDEHCIIIVKIVYTLYIIKSINIRSNWHIICIEIIWRNMTKWVIIESYILYQRKYKWQYVWRPGRVIYNAQLRSTVVRGWSPLPLSKSRHFQPTPVQTRQDTKHCGLWWEWRKR